MNDTLKHKLFNNLDFNSILDNQDFKEDSVREVIILPILKELGYKQADIVRSKSLKHPYLKIGSKKRQINLIPDYILKVEDKFALVIDAKAPQQKIINDDNVEQVYSYATHPEIRSTFFALCNGIEISIFKTTDTNVPFLYFKLEEIDFYWHKLFSLISPQSFQSGKQFEYIHYQPQRKDESYLDRKLLPEIIVRKQATKRHYGVHGYFTKQAWNVVAEYIRHFSQPEDLVLDPYGGSGVTAIEAMMNNRKAINIDLNPMAVFLVEALTIPVDFNELNEAFERVIKGYEKNEPMSKDEINKALKKYQYPKGFRLPKGSDVKVIENLFTKKQLAQLGLLKYLILKEKNKKVKNTLKLCLSGLITKVNRTYHTSKYNEGNIGGGNCAAFMYYRYRIAPNPVEIDLMKYFTIRFQKICKAKKEIQYNINENTIENLKIIKGTATDLSWIEKESVDYIYTDPPYGKKIPYLDLSIMWNAWLDLDVNEEDYQLEAIEGGEHDKTKGNYNKLIAKSIEEMFRVLKYDRWMSFVFAHKDPEFWHLIIETAERCGFEYAGAVPQKNGQTSFKKRQHPFTVLSGQLIINFKKVKNPKTILKANLGMDITEIIIQTIEGIIAKDDGATLEQINDELIIKGLELGFLDLLKKEYVDLSKLLLENFDYDDKIDKYKIKEKSRFKTNIDVRLRIKYYLISYLRRMAREHKNPDFDEIVLDLMPLLKNGTTPETQTILNVLEDIGEHIGQNKWQIKVQGQSEIFSNY